MTPMSPEIREQVRQGFKYFNRFMLLMWQLGLGWMVNLDAKRGGQIMVIQHIGRKSGKVRYTPVNFALVDGDVYCTAGFGGVTHWYRNILAQPEVEIWLPEGHWSGAAEDVSESPERLRWLRAVLIASGFAAPAAGIDPHGMSDAELDAATSDYRLLRIRRTHLRSAPGSPGSLAWVWQAATLALALLLVLRPRR